MSHQGEDGWYPECEICGAGNLGDVVCKSCYDKKETKDKDLIIHSWKQRFLSYYEDFTADESVVYEDVRKQADMACMLIPSFLVDLGLKTLEITRVEYHNYLINWDKFKEYMSKEHKNLPVKIWEDEEKDNENKS